MRIFKNIYFQKEIIYRGLPVQVNTINISDQLKECRKLTEEISLYIPRFSSKETCRYD